MADDKHRMLHTVEEIREEARRRCRARGDKLSPARAALVAAILRPHLHLIAADRESGDAA